MHATNSKPKLPSWLKNYDGLAEDGATPISRKDWLLARNSALGVPAPVKKANALSSVLSTDLLNEMAWMIQELLTRDIEQAARDRALRSLHVIGGALERRAEIAQGARERMGAVRAKRKAPTGRPPIALRCIDGNGHETIVHGYAAAQKLTGYTSIAVRMGQAKKRTGEARVTLGYASRPETMWVVDKVGTKDAVVQEACQKDENDRHEKDESS